MSGPAPGRIEFGPRSRTERQYLIDHSLGRLISELLRRGGWRTVYIADAFLVDDETTVSDDAIIARCGESGFAWITADEQARYDHAPALQEHLIDVLFVHRPKDGMNMRYMWALLTSALGHFEARTASEPGFALHCEVRPPLRDSLRELARLARMASGKQ